MKIGITYEKKCIVSDDLTAKNMGSGNLEVFATPAMITLMEGCAAESVSNELEAGATTVGTHIDVKHLAATPLGMEVTCKSVLQKVDGRSLTFSLEVWDSCGIIGKGIHERFIIDAERFMKKTYQKLEK